MPATFVIIIVVTCIFAAVCISQLIMRPVKRARSNKQWKRYKEEQHLGMR